MHYLPQLHGGDHFLPVNIKKCKCLPKTINILGGDLAFQAAACVGCVTWCGSHPQKKKILLKLKTFVQFIPKIINPSHYYYVYMILI